VVRLFRLAGFRNAYIVRGGLVWVAVRLAAGFVGIVTPNVPQRAFILVVVGAAVMIDARRRNEDLFLGNLGIPLTAILGYALILPLLFEAVAP
jgi:hypothetical protein